MTSSDVWSEQDAATYDEDVASEFEPSVIGPAVDYLRDLAEGGPVLEFAVGTGRIGVPLAAAGVSVSGIELSEPMIARLRLKVPEQTLPSCWVTWRPRRCQGRSPWSTWSSTPFRISARRQSKFSAFATQRDTYVPVGGS